MKARFITLWLAFSALFSLAQPCFAHPDHAVTTRLLFNVHFGVLTGMGENWTFDQAYSAELLARFDRNHNGQWDADEMQALETHLKHKLMGGQFFTTLLMFGETAARLDLNGFHAEAKNGIVSVSFAFAVSPPLDLNGRQLTLMLRDESYDVAFQPAALQPIELRGDDQHKCRFAMQKAPQYRYFAGLITPDVTTLECQP